MHPVEAEYLQCPVCSHMTPAPAAPGDANNKHKSMNIYRTVSELELQLHTEKGLKMIYLAERDAALRVLAELNHRVHTSYDFNADPDSITQLVGAVLNGSERIHDVWPVGAAEWKCAWPTEKEANAKLTDAGEQL